MEDELKKKGDDVEPQCRVPLVTSSKEERMLIMNAEKVKLLIYAFVIFFVIVFSLFPFTIYGKY